MRTPHSDDAKNNEKDVGTLSLEVWLACWGESLTFGLIHQISPASRTQHPSNTLSVLLSPLAALVLDYIDEGLEEENLDMSWAHAEVATQGRWWCFERIRRQRDVAGGNEGMKSRWGESLTLDPLSLVPPNIIDKTPHRYHFAHSSPHTGVRQRQSGVSNGMIGARAQQPIKANARLKHDYDGAQAKSREEAGVRKQHDVAYATDVKSAQGAWEYGGGRGGGGVTTPRPNSSKKAIRQSNSGLPLIAIRHIPVLDNKLIHHQILPYIHSKPTSTTTGRQHPARDLRNSRHRQNHRRVSPASMTLSPGTTMSLESTEGSAGGSRDNEAAAKRRKKVAFKNEAVNGIGAKRSIEKRAAKPQGLQAAGRVIFTLRVKDTQSRFEQERREADVEMRFDDMYPQERDGTIEARRYDGDAAWEAVEALEYAIKNRLSRF
ncbi:hypothetical protein R3P38DRAFT_3468766 [Favolaschia claudopus]|uniref:Uncharacterized protein n=1 Tax=Favolaschia claudopus TaxID=2862362 RepID=A0AAW0CLC6_9AGAR